MFHPSLAVPVRLLDFPKEKLEVALHGEHSNQSRPRRASSRTIFTQCVKVSPFGQARLTVSKLAKDESVLGIIYANLILVPVHEIELLVGSFRDVCV